MSWWKKDPVQLAKDRYNKSVRLYSQVLSNYNIGNASKHEVDQMRVTMEADRAALEAAEKEAANENVEC